MKRYTVTALKAIGVVLASAPIALVLHYLAAVAGWDVGPALAE